MSLQPMTPTNLAAIQQDRIVSTGEANESTPKNQRAPIAKTEKKALSEGPKLSPIGGHLPASYLLPSGTMRTDR
jgi:hypothetical protein